MTIGVRILTIVISKGLEKVFEDPKTLMQQENFDKIHTGLDEISKNMIQLEQNIQHGLRKIQNQINMEPLLHQYFDKKSAVTTKYMQIFSYANYPKPLNDVTLHEIAKDLSGINDKSIPSLLQGIHESLFGNDGQLFKFMILQILNGDALESQTIHDRIYILFIGLLSVEVQGYLAREMALILLQDTGYGNFSTEKKIAQQEATKRINTLKKNFKQVLTTADRTIWKRDPKKYKRGVTYDEITRFHQLFVLNEDSFHTCRKSCDAYKEPTEDFTRSGLISRQQPCEGYVYGCDRIDTGFRDRKLCLSNPNQLRRYEYYDNGEKNGKWGRNSDECYSIAKPFDTIFLTKCDACACVCDEPSHKKTQRTFYLGTLKADTNKNYVITGLRFEMHKKVFYLRVQESPLLPGGKVNDKASRWISRPKNLDKNKLYTINLDTRIALGDIDLTGTPDQISIVTGLRLKNIEDDLVFEAQYSVINFTDGHILSTTPKWKAFDCGKCKTVNLKENNIPIAFKNNKPNGLKGYYKFIRSSKSLDFGQSTTPFIDIRPATSTVSALTGIGFHLRSTSNSGGFIAPKLITINYATTMTKKPKNDFD